MKKVIFLFAMVLAVSFAIAQTSGNVATIDQYGSNIAEIEQTGSNNTGDIDQGTVGTPVTNNKIPSSATDWRGGAFIDQIGDDNNASINMHDGGNNGSSIYQFGNDNVGHQDIGTSHSIGNSWDLMGVDLDQVGDNNSATQTTVKSFGSAGVKRMYVVQTGNNNVADQLSIGGYVNDQNITQIGDNNNNPVESGNTFDVSATTLVNPLSLSWAHKPAGDFTQYANQMRGTSHIYVAGSNNNTVQYQEYTVWSRSGDNDAFMDVYGDNNNVVQGQLGFQNSSDIDIDGSGNVVTSSQLGDLNMVDIDLVGGSNDCVVGVEQVGNSHSATVFQSGASNFAKVIQQ